MSISQNQYEPELEYLAKQIKIMKLNLLSCDSQRPDKRAIAKCLAENANIDDSLARELTDILLEGDAVDIEVAEKNHSSALRALRKLNIEYEIVE